MASRGKLQVLMVLVVALLVATLVSAQVVKKAQSTLDDLQTVADRVNVQPQAVAANQFRAESRNLESPVVADTLAAWDRFVTDHGTSWDLMLDRRTGHAALIEGSGIPWVPGTGNALAEQAVSRDGVVRQALEFVLNYPELFGVDVNELQVMEESTGEFGGYLWYVHFRRAINGIPVERAYVVFRVNHGNLVQFGGEFLGPVYVDTVPTLDLETAQQILNGYIGGFAPEDYWVNQGSLSILPVAPAGDIGVFNGRPGNGVEYRLVYTLAFRREGVMGTWQAKIDAHTGEVLSFEDSNKYGTVSGGVYPVSPADTEVVRPFPSITVTNSTTKYTDIGGNYSYASGTASAALTGKYVRVSDTCGTSSLSTTTSPGDLAFSKSTGTDCTTPGVGGSGNTHAARSSYYALANWKVKAQTWLPSNTWLQAQLTDNVNLNQTCNAYWNGTSVNMFKSGGGCANTGELSTVVLHEVGHGLDSNDGNSSADNGTGESYGDTMGFLLTHNSCMGFGFFTDGSKCSGYGDACDTCTGIRDVDYMAHASNTPHTPLNFVKVYCPTSSSYKGPCGREGHCEGYIAAEAAWDLAVRDLPSAGYDTNTSWFILERLFYLSRATATGAYYCNTSTFASDGCATSSWFTTFRVVDDSDGNLSNGTPHAAAIYAAFNRHAIGCSTAVNTDNTTCATLTQPALTATAGTAQVSLSWGAVSGATRYWVMRNELSATSGMMKVAEVTTTSYTDTLVANGITYYYSVLALTASNSCFSKMAAVQSATPAAGATYSISGTVTGATSVTMTLSGAGSGTTTTDGSGNYTFSGLNNGTYTVTPSKTGYTFSPANLSVTISGANQTGKNFTATAVPTYSISGTVSGATASGVTITASTLSTTTATDGTYTLSGLSNGTYTVTPSKTGYTFTPTSLSVTISGANQTGKNFTSAVQGDTALTSGVGMSGSVAYQAYNHYDIVVPSGATQLVVTLTGLSADVDLYTGSPTLGNPTTASYTGRSWNSGTTNETLTTASPAAGTWNVAAYGYAAGSYTVTATVTMPSATYSISGTVSGATASGVTMSLTGAASATTTTDTSGNYTFSSLANGSYTVTPSKSGYTFSPTNIAVTISGANQTGKNFTATAATTYSISGTVSGATASGVTMSLTGASTASATTDTSGNYTFSGLANGSYTVTPSKTGYTFSPTSIAVTINGANQTGKNFTATAVSGDTPLTSGVGVSTGSMTLQTWKYYTIAVPTGATNLAITLTGLTADLDLYVNNSTTHPTTSTYYGAGTNSGTTSESLSYATPTVATWCIGVYAYAAGSGTVTATVTTGGGATTLFTNGLDASTGWAQVDTYGTAGTWSLVTSGTYPTCSRHGGTYMGKFNSYNASSGSATRYYRTSGFAIASSYTTVTLKFWMYHDTGYSSNADKIQPQVSTNGTTWVNVGTAVNRYDGTTGWKEHTVDISTYKGQTALRVAFLGTSAYGNNMFLDDVTVVAQ